MECAERKRASGSFRRPFPGGPLRLCVHILPHVPPLCQIELTFVNNKIPSKTHPGAAVFFDGQTMLRRHFPGSPGTAASPARLQQQPPSRAKTGPRQPARRCRQRQVSPAPHSPYGFPRTPARHKVFPRAPARHTVSPAIPHAIRFSSRSRTPYGFPRAKTRRPKAARAAAHRAFSPVRFILIDQTAGRGCFGPAAVYDCFLSSSAMAVPELVPMRSAPASSISRKVSALRMPPDALTAHLPLETDLRARTSSAVAPPPK